MFRGHELRGRMREWATAWHHSIVRAGPGPFGAPPIEATDRALEAAYVHGLADASIEDRHARLSVVAGGAALIPRIDRLVEWRARRKAATTPTPSDEEAIAVVVHAMTELTRLGAYEEPNPSAVRVVRGDASSRVSTMRDRAPLEGDIAVRMSEVVASDVRDTFRFLREPIYQITAYNVLCDWALWPLAEPRLGPCPLDPIVDLYERRTQAAIGSDDVVVWIERR